ncbi:MAG: hypothetical protein WD250_00525 [Egibacteraceae bacterium]
MVARAGGAVAVFSVDEVARSSKGDFPTELVHGGTDRTLLRLITCGGVFDRVASGGGGVIAGCAVWPPSP